MDRWLEYLKERCPPTKYGAVAAGLAVSGLVVHHGSFNWLAFLFAFVGISLFFILLQMMDEAKDYDKDRIAHPGRPLPRGVFSVYEFQSAINKLQVAMFVFALVVWFVFSGTAAGTYAVVAIYLWHMYREFYIGEWLERRPFTCAITHQVIIVPLALFPLSLTRPDMTMSFYALSYAFMIMGAFFTYEICRKLDPHAHPILKTYVHYHGFRRVFYFATATLFLSAIGASALDLQHLLWPVEIAVFLSLCFVYLDLSKFTFAEGTATASLFIHIWAPLIQYLWNWVWH